jgi:4-hydroxybenzoate polyprenyltransferase
LTLQGTTGSRGLRRGRLWPYLQLARPPNLVTACADVLAGFAIAGLARPAALPWLLAATACLYGGGVVLNDVFDAELDARERPERPIPSGRVPIRWAGSLGGALLAVGMGAGLLASPLSGGLAAAIAGCAVLYDGWGKRQPAVGALNMGACRGLNLLLGLSAAPALTVQRWPLALLPVAYIAAVTAVSRGEVHGGRRGVTGLALGLLGAVIAALIALGLARGAAFLPMLPFLLLFVWRVVPPFLRAFSMPQPDSIRSAVRAGVLSLVILDAVLGTVYAGFGYGVAVLALLLVAAGLARLFAVT